MLYFLLAIVGVTLLLLSRFLVSQNTPSETARAILFASLCGIPVVAIIILGWDWFVATLAAVLASGLMIGIGQLRGVSREAGSGEQRDWVPEFTYLNPMKTNRDHKLLIRLRPRTKSKAARRANEPVALPSDKLKLRVVGGAFTIKPDETVVDLSVETTVTFLVTPEKPGTRTISVRFLTDSTEYASREIEVEVRDYVWRYVPKWSIQVLVFVAALATFVGTVVGIFRVLGYLPRAS